MKTRKKNIINILYIIYIVMHFLDTIIIMKTWKKNIINKLICNVFFSCFHNYVSKNAYARHVLFSHFWSHIIYSMGSRSIWRI